MPRVPDVVRFGDFVLDVRAYELRRRGEPVKLERRPMDLLIFLVERRGELVTRTDIVDQLWGKEVFIEAESAVNTAIRKIRRALDESPETPTFIETVPGKGYRFVAPITSVSDAASAPAATKTVSARIGSARLMAAGIGAAAVVAVATLSWWWFGSSDSSGGQPMTIGALTTLTGDERGATFSPDGSQVAFTWSGEGRDNWDIHVTLVGSADVRRLTTHPAREIAPRWSFGGRHIAYLRVESTGAEHLRVMSALGGDDRQLGDLPLLPQPAWSPDDQWIAAGLATNRSAMPGGIYLLPFSGGQPRQLTRATAGGADWMPAISTDRRLAYASCTDFTSNCHVHVVPLDREWAAVGSFQRVTVAPLESVRGLTWSRDGSSVIYGVSQGSRNELWRVNLAGGPPEPIGIAGPNALFPATSPASDRLAFARGVVDQDVHLTEAFGPPRPVAPSSVLDGHPQLSPDQRRIAFCSDRTVDATEVWIAGVDGSRPERLTHGPGRWQCAPAWSRDGRSVAFESRDSAGETQIHSIDLMTRRLRRLTSGSGDRRMPSWSRTGEWIYFSWDDGSGRDMWRVRADGAAVERVTRTGSGLAAIESFDGTTLFYQGPRVQRVHEPTDAPLLAQPLGGGAPRPVIDCVLSTAFAVGEAGVFYLPCQPASRANPAVFVLDPATGKHRSLGVLQGYENTMPSGFSASADGRTFVYSRLVSRGEDLMLVENFK